MVIDLQDLQIEIGDVVIGSGTPVSIGNVEGLGTTDLLDREYDNPGEDGTQFGAEYRVGRKVEISAGIAKPGDEVGAWDLSGQLAGIFDDPEIRRSPRAVRTMRLRRPGAATRVLFGRPGDYEPDLRMAVAGWIPFNATFRCVDPKFYSDTEHSVILSMSASSSGGIVTEPDGSLLSPIVTVAGATRQSVITNEGDIETWPVIEIGGPILNPSVRLIDDAGGTLWRIALDSSLAYDQVAVIDTRPWNRQAALDSGAPLNGALSRDSVPSRSSIPPGTWELVVGGTDVTGTATFTIRWRDAFGKP